MTVYTMGLWHVKSGHEADFVAAWRDLATATSRDFPGAAAVLLRDRESPSLFVSVGPWESLDQIEQWRASQTFTSRVAAIRSHLDSFEPHTLDPIVSVGDDPHGSRPA